MAHDEPRYPGFWFPQEIEEQLFPAGMQTEQQAFSQGRHCPAGEPAAGVVTAWWPRLDPGQWRQLTALLKANRRKAPTGSELWERLQAALQHAGRRLADPRDTLHRQAMAALPGYTGYSPAMIGMALGALDLFSLEHFPGIFACPIDRRALSGWQPLGGLLGMVHFQAQSPGRRLAAHLGGSNRLYGAAHPLKMILGYGSGNVPGAALLMILLGMSSALAQAEMPAMLVRNSRREPIFTPLVMQALAEADPDLVAGTAALVWDYEDAALQEELLGQADLVIAAASDETTGRLRSQIQGLPGKKPPFHAHGHKVSFAAIGKEALARDQIDEVALLAGLDSAFWDQHGCLSARVHFVEEGGSGFPDASAYASALQAQLARLAGWLPRGAWPRQLLHDRFDAYKQLEAGGQVQVFSGYEDAFVVVLDRRPLSGESFRRLVNDCQGRVVVVRPVADWMEIPQRYLRYIPAANLQSLSVALGRPGQPPTPEFLRFALACSQAGVTAIRSVGRGAFPQLAYSWDGFLPPDLLYERPPGYFTTIEFDSPGDALLETRRLFTSFMSLE